MPNRQSAAFTFTSIVTLGFIGKPSVRAHGTKRFRESCQRCELTVVRWFIGVPSASRDRFRYVLFASRLSLYLACLRGCLAFRAQATDYLLWGGHLASGAKEGPQ
jgi:hypothetical protein